MTAQLALFDDAPAPAAAEMPEGFAYAPELVTADDEARLVAAFAALPLKPFEFHGFEGKRRVVSFGWRYVFDGSGLTRADDVPDFLLPLRERAAAFAGLPAEALPHAMITEYAAGAAIGWHRDRPDFGEVVGVSLVSPCTFRLRRREGERWLRRSLTLAPRSAYVLRGPVRSDWQHSIPAVAALRYSVTFRTLAEAG